MNLRLELLRPIRILTSELTDLWVGQEVEVMVNGQREEAVLKTLTKDGTNDATEWIASWESPNATITVSVPNHNVAARIETHQKN